MVGMVTLGRCGSPGVDDDAEEDGDEEEGVEDDEEEEEEDDARGRKVFTRGRGRAVLGTLPPWFVAGG